MSVRLSFIELSINVINHVVAGSNKLRVVEKLQATVSIDLEKKYALLDLYAHVGLWVSVCPFEHSGNTIKHVLWSK